MKVKYIGTSKMNFVGTDSTFLKLSPDQEFDCSESEFETIAKTGMFQKVGQEEVKKVETKKEEKKVETKKTTVVKKTNSKPKGKGK